MADVNNGIVATGAENQGKTQDEGRTFTQDEVNKIVQDRLERERNKSQSDIETQLEEKERNLNRREMQMKAREKLADQNLPKDLADLIDFSDTDKFEEQLNKAVELGTQIRNESRSPRKLVDGVGALPKGDFQDNDNPFMAAYKPPKVY